MNHHVLLEVYHLSLSGRLATLVSIARRVPRVKKYPQEMQRKRREWIDRQGEDKQPALKGKGTPVPIS